MSNLCGTPRSFMNRCESKCPSFMGTNEDLETCLYNFLQGHKRGAHVYAHYKYDNTNTTDTPNLFWSSRNEGFLNIELHNFVPWEHYERLRSPYSVTKKRV